MKRVLAFTVLTVVIIFLTACNNVNKPTYNGNANNSFLQSDAPDSSMIYNEQMQNSSSVDSTVQSDTVTSSTESKEEAQSGSLVNENTSSDSENVSSIPADHIHQFKAATCTEPKTCSECGTTEGEPLGHKWMAATCKYPKTCLVCKATDNKLGKHIYINGRCSVCDETDPNMVYVPLNSANWVANMIDEDILHQIVISSASETDYYISYYKYEVASDTATVDDELTYIYNGVKYLKTDSADKIAINVEEIRETIYITDANENRLVLTRFSEDVLKITETGKKCFGYEKLLREGIDFKAEITE